MRLLRGRRRRSGADAYAAAVAFYLRDIRRAQRLRLVADLRQHLAEMPAADDFTASLGPPRQYAAELRSSNGIEPARGLARLRRFGPVWWISATLAVAVVTFAVVAGVWLARYQPLQLGMWESVPGKGVDYVFGDNANIVADYQDGVQYQFAVSVHNNGPLDVEITGAPLRDFMVGPVLIYEMRLDAPHKYGVGEEAAPFHAFTLRANDERGLVFRGVLTKCDLMPDGGASVLDSFEIRYRVFGIDKSQTITLRNPAAIRMPGAASSHCPLPRPQEGSNGVDTETLGILHTGGSVNVEAVSPAPGTGDLAYAAWVIPPRCTSASIPSGRQAFPLDVVVYENPHSGQFQVPSALPIDLRFGFAGSPANVLLTACRAGAPVHVESIDDGDIFVAHGVVLLPQGTCGPQPLDVDVAENGRYRSAGPVLLDVPCSPVKPG